MLLLLWGSLSTCCFGCLRYQRPRVSHLALVGELLLFLLLLLLRSPAEHSVRLEDFSVHQLYNLHSYSWVLLYTREWVNVAVCKVIAAWVWLYTRVWVNVAVCTVIAGSGCDQRVSQCRSLHGDIWVLLYTREWVNVAVCKVIAGSGCDQRVGQCRSLHGNSWVWLYSRVWVNVAVCTVITGS